jgi:hypothetical protein
MALQDQIEEKNRRINELAVKAKETESQLGRDYEHLHESFNKAEKSLGSKSLDYEASIAFLDSQLKKSALTI